MARVIFLKLDPGVAGQLRQLVTAEGHEVSLEKYDAPIGRISSGDVVFFGGSGKDYLSLLRRLRAADSRISLIVIARSPDTTEWLSALEAGATDYLVAPLDTTMIRALLAQAPTPVG